MALPEKFYFLSLTEAAKKIREREISCAELTEGLLERIAALDPDLKSYITVPADAALKSAAEADAALKRREPLGALHGIPIALKDVVATAGIPTTANSRVLQDSIPSEDASFVRKLKTAGAIIIGKLNMNEFAWSIPSENDLHPPPRNPWQPAYAAIGSSSGSGAAVAAGLCFGSFGTDAGGSIRLPSASCGLIGLKPTHGRISRHGVMGARSIMDDSLEYPLSKHSAARNRGLRALRLGVPWKEIESAGVNREIQGSFEGALRECEALGATVVAVNPPGLAEARAANFIVLNAEEYSDHEQGLRTRLSEYGASARLYLLQGAFLSSADYLRAMRVRAIVRGEIDRLFSEVDILISPTSPFLTPDAAREPAAHRSGVGAAFTAPFNLTGHPALSMPCGISSVGLPMGIQLVARRLDEGTLLDAADSFQQHIGWATRHPAMPFAEREQTVGLAQKGNRS